MFMSGAAIVRVMQARILAKRYRVVVFDRPGFGHMIHHTASHRICAHDRPGRCPVITSATAAFIVLSETNLQLTPHQNLARSSAWANAGFMSVNLTLILRLDVQRGLWKFRHWLGPVDNKGIPLGLDL
jgi:hypothetical protein